MKAAVLVEPGKIEIKNVQSPEPGPGELLIRVTLAGICGSDYSLYNGKFDVPLPVIPGHEAIGRIKKLGSGVTGLEIGQRVTIQPNFSCHHCTLCLSGNENICPSKVRLGIDRNGVFADYVKVPTRYVWPIPEGLKDEIAVFAEPLAAVAHAFTMKAPSIGEHTLILGTGVMGLLTLQMAVLNGAEVSACDINQKHLALAEQLGATQVIDANNLPESLYNSFDLVYETCGADSALAQAIQLAAPGGKIVILGLAGKDYPVPSVSVVRKELQIMGSMIYTNEFPQVIDLLNSGRFDTESLISERLGLSELDRALSDFISPDRVKMLVTI